MAKAKQSVALVTKSIYDLLEPFDAGERGRILNSVMALFGEALPSGGGGAGGGGGGPGAGGGGGSDADLVRRGARAYFDHKDPKNKNEEFATAARYLEHTTSAVSALKADFQRVISTEARRSFHDGNFGRDIDNARAAKFFNPGGSAATGFTLSHVGQNYVDALPDREKAKAVKKAAKSGKKRKATKKRKVGAKS